MNIFPKIGIDSLKLGISRNDVQSKLGAPANKENHAEEEIWEYDSGIELSFQEEDGYRLSSITVFAESALLDSKPIIGITESELEAIFPSFQLDEDFKQDGKSFYADDLQIMAWVFEGEVFNIIIFPEYDEASELPIWPK
ncbi:hypothetical protein [Cellvibrio mixtus]|uniref:hypothetical protein n=1 Tax=Cellvibrio mixtus TaxID=39650 RepID=UPI000693E088|nr:hypothetical protein [Cellvibrio mixtus]